MIKLHRSTFRLATRVCMEWVDLHSDLHHVFATCVACSSILAKSYCCLKWITNFAVKLQFCMYKQVEICNDHLYKSTDLQNSLQSMMRLSSVRSVLLFTLYVKSHFNAEIMQFIRIYTKGRSDSVTFLFLMM